MSAPSVADGPVFGYTPGLCFFPRAARSSRLMSALIACTKAWVRFESSWCRPAGTGRGRLILTKATSRSRQFSLPCARSCRRSGHPVCLQASAAARPAAAFHRSELPVASAQAAPSWIPRSPAEGNLCLRVAPILFVFSPRSCAVRVCCCGVHVSLSIVAFDGLQRWNRIKYCTSGANSLREDIGACEEASRC